MAQYTLADINNFPVSADGFKMCPSGDYSLINDLIAFPKYRFWDEEGVYTFKQGLVLPPWKFIEFKGYCTLNEVVATNAIVISHGNVTFNDFVAATIEQSCRFEGSTFNFNKTGLLNCVGGIRKAMFVGCNLSINATLTIDGEGVFDKCKFNVASNATLRVLGGGYKPTLKNCEISGSGNVSVAQDSVQYNNKYVGVDALSGFVRNSDISSIEKWSGLSSYSNAISASLYSDITKISNIQDAIVVAGIYGSHGNSNTRGVHYFHKNVKVLAGSRIGSCIYSNISTSPSGVALGRSHIVRYD